jgi:hypothetical protein
LQTFQIFRYFTGIFFPKNIFVFILKSLKRHIQKYEIISSSIGAVTRLLETLNLNEVPAELVDNNMCEFHKNVIGFKFDLNMN